MEKDISSHSYLIETILPECWEEDIFLVADALLLARYFQNIIYIIRNNFLDIILPLTSDKGISLLVNRLVLTV